MNRKTLRTKIEFDEPLTPFLCIFIAIFDNKMCNIITQTVPLFLFTLHWAGTVVLQ